MKKVKKIKEFRITDKIFKTKCLFITNCDYKEFTKRIKKYGIEAVKADSYVNGTVIEGKDKFFRIVWYENLTQNPEDLGGFFHEIFHLVVRICKDRGVPIKANIETGEVGDETAAYLLEYYIIEVLEKLNKKTYLKTPKKKK